MAFDPKVAAGGVAVVAIGGGAGVAIHQGTSSSSKEQTDKKTGIQMAIENAEFTIETINDTCKAALEKDLNKKSDYKSAVLACVKEKTFKERAKKLKLDLLSTENLSNNADTDWTNKWNKQKTLIKTLKGESGNEWNSISEGAQKIKDFCDSTTPFTETAKTEDWYKFLKICVKEDGEAESKSKKLTTALGKDFWYYKETIRSKMKTAGFEEPVSLASPCTEDQLHETYEQAKYKKAIKDCAKSKKFKERAEELKLDAMPESGEDSFWTDGWEEVKVRVKSVVSDLSSEEEGSWSSAKTKVKKYCDSNNKNIEETTNNEDWKNYLKACTKDKGQDANKVTTESVLKKDFWTNK